MYEGSDTMESSPTFSKGDIVWVKLSSYWWPGEVINEDDLPEDLLSDFKKPPLVIVKFFDEDSYEYVKNWSNIFPYNCPKKNDFIKKGMAGFRAKLSHMAKFPKDVGTAEEKTNGNPNILSQPEFLPVKKINYDEIFGTPSPKRTAKGKASMSSSKTTPKERYAKGSNQPHITHRRFLGNDDYRAYICIQYPGKDRQWDSDDDEIKKLNEEPEKLMSCQSCSFKTTRLEVMILHTKMHIQGIYITAKRKPKKSKGAISDSESDTGPTKSPKPKQRKKKEVVKPEAKDIFTNLLEEWDDTDEETEETQKKSSKPKKKSNKPVEALSDNEKDELEDENDDQENQNATKKTLGSSHIVELSESQSSLKDTQEDIKNCFDFDEEEEEDDFLLPTSVGRKIPRVIPEKPKPTISELLEKSQKAEGVEKEDVVESIDEIEKQIASMEVETDSEKNILRVSQGFGKDPDVDESIENTFKELMQETELPTLDDLVETLKPEQNFHDARTIKFPDKGGTTLKGGGTSKKTSVTGKDLDVGFLKVEAEKTKDKKLGDDLQVKDSETSEGTRFTQDDNQDSSHVKSDDKSTNIIKNSQDSTEVIPGKNTITPAPKSYRSKRSRARLSEVVIETTPDEPIPSKTAEDICKQLEEQTAVLPEKRISSMDRRQTRHSQQNKNTELDQPETKESTQEDALDSKRSSRRRTKQFVIEEDSEEIIEITTGIHSDILDSTEEIIVHMDDEARAKLAAIDSEIEELKKSLEATQSSLETGIEKSETIEIAEEPTLQDKVEEPIETKVDQETQVAEVQKKSKRKTRHTMSNEDLQISEKINQNEQTSEALDITAKPEMKSQRKHSKEESIPGGSTVKSFEEPKDSREVENQKEIEKARKKSKKKHSKDEVGSVEDLTKKIDEKQVSTKDESIKHTDNSEAGENASDKLRRKSLRNHSKEESRIAEDEAGKTIEGLKVSTEDDCIEHKGENSGTIPDTIDEVKGKSQKKHHKKERLPAEDTPLKSVQEQKESTEDENFRQKAEISEALEEIMDKVKRKSQRKHSKQESMVVESPREHKLEDKNIKQEEGSSNAVKAVTDKRKRKNQRLSSKDEHDSTVRLDEDQIISTVDQDKQKVECSGAVEGLSDIGKRKIHKKYLKGEVPIEELTVKLIEEPKVSTEDENIRRKEESTGTVKDNSDKAKRNSQRKHAKDEITPVELLVARLVGEQKDFTEDEKIRQKEESSEVVENITDKVIRKSQRKHSKGESMPVEVLTVKLTEEQKVATDVESISQKVQSSEAVEETEKVKRRSQRKHIKEELTPAKDIVAELVRDQTISAESKETIKQKEESSGAVEDITDKEKRKIQRKNVKEENISVSNLPIKLVEDQIVSTEDEIIRQKEGSSGAVEASDKVKRKSQRIHLKEEIQTVKTLLAESVEEQSFSAEHECIEQKEACSGAIEATDKVKRKSRRIHSKEEIRPVEDLITETVEEQKVSAEQENVKHKEESSRAVEDITDKLKRKSRSKPSKVESMSVEDSNAKSVKEQKVSIEDENIIQKEQSSGVEEATDKVKTRSQRIHEDENIKQKDESSGVVEVTDRVKRKSQRIHDDENIRKKEEGKEAIETTDKIKRKSQRIHSKEEINTVEDLIVELVGDPTASDEQKNFTQNAERSAVIEATDKVKGKRQRIHSKEEIKTVEDLIVELVEEPTASTEHKYLIQKEESSLAIEATEKVKRKSQRIHSKDEVKPVKDLKPESVEEQTISAQHERSVQEDVGLGALEHTTDNITKKSQRKNVKGESMTVEDLTVNLVEEQKVSTEIENIRHKEESFGALETSDKVKRKSQRIHLKEEMKPVEDLIVELVEEPTPSPEHKNTTQKEKSSDAIEATDKVKRKSRRLHLKDDIPPVEDSIVELTEEKKVSAEDGNIKQKEERSGNLEDFTDKGKRKSKRIHVKEESLSAEHETVELVSEQKASTAVENIGTNEESSGLPEATNDKFKTKSLRILSNKELSPVEDIRQKQESSATVEDITVKVESTIQGKNLKEESMSVKNLTVELVEEKTVSTKAENVRQIKEDSGAVADNEKLKSKSQRINIQDEIESVEDLKVDHVAEQKVLVEDNLPKSSELILERRRGTSRGLQKDEKNNLKLAEKVTGSDSNAEKLDNTSYQTTNTLEVPCVSKDSKFVAIVEEPIRKTESKLKKQIDEFADTTVKVIKDLKETDNVSLLALPENLKKGRRTQDIFERDYTSDRLSRSSRTKTKNQEKKEDYEKSNLKELATYEKTYDILPKPLIPTLVESGPSKSNIDKPAPKIRKSRWDQPPKEVLAAEIENKPKTVHTKQEHSAATESTIETTLSKLDKSKWHEPAKDECVVTAKIENELKTVCAEQPHKAAAESKIETPVPKVRRSRWDKYTKEERVVTVETKNELKAVSAEQEHSVSAELKTFCTEQEHSVSAELKTFCTEQEHEVVQESKIETTPPKIRKSRWDKSAKGEHMVIPEIENQLKTFSTEQEYNAAADLLEMARESSQAVSEILKSSTSKTSESKAQESPNKAGDNKASFEDQPEKTVIQKSSTSKSIESKAQESPNKAGDNKARFEHQPKKTVIQKSSTSKTIESKAQECPYKAGDDKASFEDQPENTVISDPVSIIFEEVSLRVKTERSRKDSKEKSRLIPQESHQELTTSETDEFAGSDGSKHSPENPQELKDSTPATIMTEIVQPQSLCERFPETKPESKISASLNVVDTRLAVTDTVAEVHTTDIVATEIVQPQSSNDQFSPKSRSWYMREPGAAVPFSGYNSKSQIAASASAEVVDTKAAVTDTVVVVHSADIVATEIIQPQTFNEESSPKSRSRLEPDVDVPFPKSDSESQISAPASAEVVGTKTAVTDTVVEVHSADIVATEIIQPQTFNEESSPKSRSRLEPDVDVHFPKSDSESQIAAPASAEVVDTKAAVTDTVVEVHSADIVATEIIQPQTFNEESSPKSRSRLEPDVDVPFPKSDSESQIAAPASAEVVDTKAAVTDIVVEVHSADIVATEIIQPQTFNEESTPKSRSSLEPDVDVPFPKSDSESQIAAPASVEVSDISAAVTDNAVELSTSDNIVTELVQPQVAYEESSPKSRRGKHSKLSKVAEPFPENISASQKVTPDSLEVPKTGISDSGLGLDQETSLKSKQVKSKKNTKDKETIAENDTDTLKESQLKELSTEVSILESPLSVPLSEITESSKCKRSRARKLTKGEKESSKCLLTETEVRQTSENKAYADFSLSEETYSKTRRGRSRKQTKEEEDFARAIEESLKDLAQKSKVVHTESDNQVPDSKKSDPLEEITGEYSQKGRKSKSDPLEEMTGEYSQKGRKSRSRRFQGDVTSDQTKEEEDFARAIEASLKDMEQKSKDALKKSHELSPEAKKLDMCAEMSEEHSKKGKKGRPRKYSKGAEHDPKISKDEASSHQGDATSDTILSDSLVQAADGQKDISQTPPLHSDSRKSKIEQKPKRRKSRSHTSEQFIISSEESTAKDLAKPDETAAIISDSVAMETSIGEKRKSSDIATVCQTDEPIADEQREIVAAKLENSETVSQADLKIEEKSRKQGREKVHTETASSLTSDDKQAEELSAALEFTKTVLELVESQQSSLESANSSSIKSLNEPTHSSRRRKSTTSYDEICEPNGEKPLSAEKKIDKKSEEPRRGRTRKHSKREDVLPEDVLKLQHGINETKEETVILEDQQINLEVVGSETTAGNVTKRAELATGLELFQSDQKMHSKTKRRRSSTPAKTFTDTDVDGITVSKLTNYRDLEETSPKAKRGRPRKHNTEDISSVPQNIEKEAQCITTDINLKDDVQPAVSESTSVENNLQENDNKIGESSPFKAKRGRPRRYTKDYSLPTTQVKEQQPEQLTSTKTTSEHGIEEKENVSAPLVNETDVDAANRVICQVEDLSSINSKTLAIENEEADNKIDTDEPILPLCEENPSLNILHGSTKAHEVDDSVFDANTQKIENLSDCVPLRETLKENQDGPAIMKVAGLSKQLEITEDTTDKVVGDHSAEPVPLIMDETENPQNREEKESSILTKPMKVPSSEMEVIKSSAHVNTIENSSVPETVTSPAAFTPETIEKVQNIQLTRSDDKVSQSLFDKPVGSVSVDTYQVEIEKEVQCDMAQNDARNIDQIDLEANSVENTQTVVQSQSETGMLSQQSSGSHQELEIVEKQADLNQLIHMEAEGILEEVVVSNSIESEKVESKLTTNKSSDTLENMTNADEIINVYSGPNVPEEEKTEKDNSSNEILSNIEENRHEEKLGENTSIVTTSEDNATMSEIAKVSIETCQETEENNKPVPLSSVECEEKNRHVPPKKNRWPWRSSYVKTDDNASKQQVVPCESVVREEVLMGEQIVEDNNKAVIEANTTVDKFECNVNTSEDKNLFNKTDLVESNTLSAPGTSENSSSDLNDSEIILPPKKSKRLSEVKFDFLHDDFASEASSTEKKDVDNLGFPNCDDSIMSTSLRNNIEGLIKDIDSFDSSCVSDSLNKHPEADTGHDEAEKNDLALVSIKEPANVVKSVPPKKKKIEFSKPVEHKESTYNKLPGESSKNEEKSSDVIPQPPKKKIQKLFENSQALEKLARGNDMPLMSPLAKKKNFLFQQEEMEQAQKINDIAQLSGIDSADLEKNTSETDSLFNENLISVEQPISSLAKKEGEVDVDKFFTLPKKRKKRKSSSYGEQSHKKERRASTDTVEVKKEEDVKELISSLDIIKTAGGNDSLASTPVKDELITTDSAQTNQMEVNLEEVDFKFNIQTNLSNLATSKAEELSAIASSTLSEIKNKSNEEKEERNLACDENKEPLETSVIPKDETNTPKEDPVVPVEPIMPEGHPTESEFVPIAVTPTVMSEKDLADAQVEITTDKVINEKKPTSLGMFSMDFLDTSQPGKTIPVKIRKTDMGTTKVTNTLGTEFTSKAMTKEFDNRSLTTQPKAYALKSELLDILEGNSNSSTNSSGSEQKFKTSFDNYDKQNVVQGMFDFEEAIPSQIVLSNKVNPETVLMESPKLLERLSKTNDASKPKKVVIQSDIKVSEGISKGLISKVTKPLGTPRPGQKIIIKTSKSQPMPKPTGNKPIILSEQIIRPANALKPIQKPVAQPQGIKRQYEDIEDVETAFIIPKIAKKTTEEIIPVTVEKLPRARTKSGGKAKIIQQTIITPKGEIIQPQTATTKTVKPVQMQAAQPQADDTVFDINSMPIVLSDDLLTPESIQNMPVVLSEDVIPHGKVVGVKSDEKILSTVAKKVVANVGPKQQIVFKTTPPGSATTVPAKQMTKPRILSNVSASSSKIPKPSPAALLATGTSADGKPTKYVLVPSTVTQNVPQMKTVKQPMIKKPQPAQTKVANLQPSEPPSQVVGNKIMIVTNQHGQQTRVVLTPQQQKAFMNAQPGSKTKAIIKGAIPKALLETAAAAAAGPSGAIQRTAASGVSQGVTPTVSSQGGLLMTVGKGTKTPMQPKKSTKTPAKPQKTILIKNQLGQTVRKIQGTDDADLDRQVMEQLEAIKASARLQQANKSPEIINYTNRPIPSSTNAGVNRSSTVRRSYSKKVEPIKVKPTASIPQSHVQSSAETSVPALAPLSPQPKSPQVQSQTSPSLPKQLIQPKADHTSPVNSMAQQQSTASVKSETKAIPTTSGGPESKAAERPLTQLVIQDGLGNQTTITEGQILAIPSETVDGQPQSYMLVTLDEMGNITPLNNEALMSLDPSLGLGGDLNNMVLQVDQGQGTVAALKPAETSSSAIPVVSNIEQKKIEERLKPEPHKMVQPAVEPKPASIEPSKSQEAPMAVEQQIVIGEGVLPGADPGGQQLIVTGDPIATQKFLESLSDGSTDLANILANAEGGSVLIQADGQQILIKTNTGNQSMLGIAESTEGGGNPIFANHKPNQDILAAALANTDVFQGSDQQAVHSSPIKGLQSSQLSPSTGAGVLYPMHVSNVLETSLTLSSPIMTPLEVPSMPTKKIDDDVDILNQVPKNVDLPITITDPNISQTVAQQQAIGLMELNHLIGEIKPTGPIDMDPFKSSLPSLDEPLVGAAQKSFNGSMPLLTEDVTEAESGESSQLGEIRVVKGLEENQSGYGSNFGSLPMLPETVQSSREEVVKTSCFGEMGSLPSLTEDVIEDSGSSIGSTKQQRTSPKPIERDIVDEGLSTLGGEMCSSLSEPPPDMFDLASITGKEEEISSDVSIPEPEGETLSLHSDNSGEIPIQPPIVANLNDLKRPREDTDGQDEKRLRTD